MSIRLHSKLGVNPRLTFCPQCGGETNELLLLGATNKVYRCTDPKCNTPHIGSPPKGFCQRCGRAVKFERELDDWEKLPGSICDACQAKNKAVDEEVAKGGIYWRCKDCGSAGAIRAGHPLAEQVREQMNLQPPAPCGVELTKEPCKGLACPVCGPEAQVEEGGSVS